MGIGNLRGWAVAEDGIESIEVYIDGRYVFDAPYGGDRPDVGGAFPDVPSSDRSGYSLAFNYSELSIGQHTVSTVARSLTGDTVESSADFTVTRFGSAFVADPISLDGSQCLIEDDSIRVFDAMIDGRMYDLLLDWRRAEQGFEIVEIR